MSVPSERSEVWAGASKSRRSRLLDRLFQGGSLGVALGLLALLVLMVWVLAQDGNRVFAKYGINFITGTHWVPTTGRQQFGAFPAIYGTLVTSAIAIVLAVPVAVGLALLLNESGLGWFRNVLAVFVDLLAAVPSVVYGLWALFVMKPVFDNRVEPFLHATLGRIPLVGALFQGNTNGGDLFTAGVILAIMILPIVTAVSREVLAVVPKDLREAAQALGATRYETVRMAVLPYARSGIVGASMLGLGRALGETIAVAMVVGNVPFIHASLFSPGYTIPAVIANEFREASTVGLHRSALLGLALVLMVIALAVAALSRALVRRTGERAGGDVNPGTTAALAASGGRGAVP
jgi:phosphate transport system permease protein